MFRELTIKIKLLRQYGKKHPPSSIRKKEISYCLILYRVVRTKFCVSVQTFIITALFKLNVKRFRDFELTNSSACVDTIGVWVVVERNDKTFDAKINALMKVWKNVPEKKTDLQNDLKHIIQYGTILGQLLKVLLFMLANLSKFINYCIYLSLLPNQLTIRMIRYIIVKSIF